MSLLRYAFLGNSGRLNAFGHSFLTKTVKPQCVFRSCLSYSAASAERINQSKEVGKKRPLSPHITIWRWEFPMLLSLTHRATGISLAGGFMATAVIIMIVGPETFLRWLKSTFHPYLLFLLKFGTVFALSYHTLNGVRHITWDFGKLLKVSSIYKSGYVVVSMAFLVTLISTYWFDERDVSTFIVKNKSDSH